MSSLLPPRVVFLVAGEKAREKKRPCFVHVHGMIDEGRKEGREEEIFVVNGELNSQLLLLKGRRRMKIVTYNVNGIKQRISQHGGSLLNLLNSLDSDIICFQETKLSRDEITADLIMAEGYESFFSCTSTSGRGRTGYSGVATFCRVKSAFSSKEVALPLAAEEGFTGLLEHTTRGNSMKKDYLLQVSVKVELEGITKEEMLRVDSEGRCIITDHGHFVLFNLYGPRAGVDDEERVQFKLTFFKILQKRWETLLSQGKRVIVVGDLNIAPAAIDRCDADPKFEENQFRKWLRSLLVEQGGPFFDVFRSKHPERKAYTCWAVHNGAEQFNYGSRIDHILIAGPCLHQDHDMQDHNIIECHVNECDILTQFKRWKPENNSISRWKGGRSIKLEGSDHVPVFANLMDIPDLQEHSTPSLAARYVPKIHGLQQTIVTFFSKRQLSAEVKNPAEPLLADGNDTQKSCDDSFDRSLHYCSVSGSPSVASSSNQECEDFSPSSNEQLSTQMNPAAEENTVIMLRKETTKSLLPCHMKTNKKARIGSSSQRTLQSYFQKKPSPIVANYSASAKSQISLGKDHNLNGEDDSILLPNELTSPKGTPGVSDGNNDLQKNEFNTSPSDLSQCDVNICSSTAKDKYNVAMSEWQRIQQLMHKHKTVPLCKGHAEPCVARVVKKTGPTFGRKFYVCCRAEGPSANPETNCGYFEWADSKSGKKRK